MFTVWLIEGTFLRRPKNQECIPIFHALLKETEVRILDTREAEGSWRRQKYQTIEISTFPFPVHDPLSSETTVLQIY